MEKEGEIMEVEMEEGEIVEVEMEEGVAVEEGEMLEVEEGETVDVQVEDGEIVEEGEMENGKIFRRLLEEVNIFDEKIEMYLGGIRENFDKQMRMPREYLDNMQRWHGYGSFLEEGEVEEVEVEVEVEDGAMEMGEIFRRLLEEVNIFDEKIEMYLGGIRKKFYKQMRMEGEFSLERLVRGEYSVEMSMVGGYGSFLPTYNTRHTNEFYSRQRGKGNVTSLQALTATVSALRTLNFQCNHATGELNVETKMILVELVQVVAKDSLAPTTNLLPRTKC